MFIRKANVLIPLATLLALAALPTAGAAQDAAAVLQSVREAIGEDLPASVRLTAAGSGYAATPDDPSTRRHFRIERYTQELDLRAPASSEQLVRLGPATEGGKAEPQTVSHAVTADSPWPEQSAIWTTPLGFLAGASSRPATLTSETLYGTPYRVIAFTTAGGQQVRGYITEENVLARTRTEVQDPARGTVTAETVFFDWADFDGLKFPTVVIQRENDEVVRILIVSAIDQGGTTPAGSR